MRRLGAVLTALALCSVGVACGDDDNDAASGGSSPSSDDGQEYVDAIVASSGDDEIATEADVECLARSLVDAVGVDTLREAGVSPQDLAESDASLSDVGISLDDSQADAFWTDLNQCMDVRALFFGSIAADEQFSDETADCLDDAIDDDLLERFLVGVAVEGQDAIQSDDQLTRDLASAFAQCPGALPDT